MFQRRLNFQALLLRISVVSLLIILILALLTPVALAAGNGSLHLTVQYRGKSITTTASAGTVGELLDRLGLALSGEDRLSHDLGDSLVADMVITVDHVAVREEVYTAAVPYAVSYCWDPSIPRGVEAVLVAGKEGELQTAARVTYRNGKEVSREILRQDVITPAVTQIIAQGTGSPASEPVSDRPVIGDGYIELPTGEVLTYTDVKTMTASAYSHMDRGCDSITATGTWVHWGTVAVNPKYIPYGTRMFILSSDGSFIYGIGCAEDRGSAGKDRIDLYMPTYQECIQFGRQECTVYFLG